jgi:hypothetical protein
VTSFSDPKNIPCKKISNFFCEVTEKEAAGGGNRVAIAPIEKKKTKIIAALRHTMMPWLVPACSREDLNNAVEAAGAPLLSGAQIAGLVPGVASASFDAYAYGWASLAPLEWSFDFKARSESHSLADAIRALEAKCS